ncbi:MAG: hypothetical protein K6U04_04340 [Armatimonadetes bacterium]|nr:hypothetical protein [Armatimonadota bacterium]
MPENNERLPFLRLGWAIWFLILVLSAFIVPYAFLSGVPKITGAFLYWTLFALVAMVSIFCVTSYWRD